MKLGLILGVLAAAVAGCGGSSSGGATVADGQLAPIFRGLKGAATAGGAIVRLDWRDAVDESTPAASIRYQVFAAATAGGQDFDAPIATTAGGATDIVLTGANSALIAVGQTAFFVVRALDGDGLRDDNRVELVVHFVAAVRVAHVDDTAGGGTLGDPSDPFPTIQGAIDAVEGAGGGVVLVSAAAGGTAYVGELLIDDDTASCVALYGGFPRFTGLATPADILAARDVAGFPASLDADLADLSDEDLVRVVNDFVLTILDGFTFSGFDVDNAENFAVRGFDVRLQISCCTLLDSAIVGVGVPVQAPPPVPPTQTSDVAFVGNDAIRDLEDPTESSVDSFQVFGPTGRLLFQNNTTDEQSSSLQGALGVPAAGQQLLVSHNLLTGGSSTIDLDFDPVDPLNGGALVVTFERNEIRDTGSNAFEVDDLGDVGANGSATLRMHKNFTQGVSSDPIDLECLGTEAHAGVDITITITDNIFSGSNSIGVDASLTTSAGGTTSLVVRNNFMSVGESESMEISDQSSETDDVHDGGRMAFTAQGNVIFGGFEDLEVELGTAHGGRTDVVIYENMIVNSEDEGLRLDLEGNLGTTTGPTTFPNGVIFWTVFNNDVRAEDETAEVNDSRSDSDASAAFCLFANNVFGFTTDPSTGVGMEFRPSSGGQACYLLQRNFFGSGGSDSEDAISIDTLATDPPQLIRLSNNTLAFASGAGVEFDAGGPRPQLVNNTIAFNAQDGNFGVETSGNDPQAFLHNCIVSHNSDDIERSTGVTASFTLVRDEGVPVGFGNVGGEPFFLKGPEQFLNNLPLGDEVATVRDLFTLRAGSPARNAGDPDARFNDPDGSRNDMGAFGGPGSGTIGPMAGGTPLPFVFLGSMPKVDLFTGAELVDGDATLSFAFSRAVDPATIAAGLRVRSGGADVAGAFGTAFDGNVVTFTPTGQLSTGDLVEVSVSTALRDASGQAHWYPFTYRFGTRPAAATPETEPNDVNDGVIDALDIGAAQALGAGPVFLVAGTIGDSTDVDVYAFSVTAGERIMARLRGTVASCTPRLELRDGAGNVLATGGIGTFDNGGLQDPYLDHVAASTGTIYLLTFDPDPTPANPYELSVVVD